MSIYEQLDSITDFDERVKYIATIDVATTEHPAGLTEYFHDVKDQEDPFDAAIKVAQAFKDAGGLIIIDSTWTKCVDAQMLRNKAEYFGETARFITIMDDLELQENDEVCNWLFLRAFKKIGFKRASECAESELERMIRK